MPVAKHTEAQILAVLRLALNRTHAAEILGIDFRNLQRRIVRMRRRGVPVPPGNRLSRRWARRPEHASA